ncbi:transferrin-binding protein-like solute binding protein [Glaesserella sp.]|uniref:transferrin-binding protein-like solute binding protein n=1 Tax=Glaesserella sp. TaxID=2094731 RepID=UPI0035A0D5D5
MMTKLLLSLIATGCIGTLTACSSSSGGGGGNAPVYFTEKPTTNADTNTSATDSGNDSAIPSDSTIPPLNTASPINGNLFQGQHGDKFVGALITIKNSGETTGQNLKSYLGEDLNVLMVNNVEVPLLPVSAEDDQAGFKTISPIDKLGLIHGYTNKATSEYRDVRYYQFVRFGVLNMNSQHTLFVQGLQTPVSGTVSELENGYATLYAMPKSGKFTYNKGDALYGKDGNYQQLIANVTADFTNKQLQVSLKESATQSEKLAFSSRIDGNTFSASHNGIDSKGAFYGSQANQVAGVFYRTEGEEAGYHGVFGATDKRRDAQ